MRYLFSYILVFVLICSLNGQSEVLYFGTNNRPVEHIEDAIQSKEVVKRSDRKYMIYTNQLIDNKWTRVNKEKIKVGNDGIQTIFSYSDGIFPKRIYREMDQIRPGEYYFKESNLSIPLRTGTSKSFLPLTLDGTVTEYHPNGIVKSISAYSNNQLLSNENWLMDGSKYIDSIFYSVDKEPEYRLGDDFFNNFLISSLTESKLDLKQVEDIVIIGWVVMEDGTLEGAIALKGKSRKLNEFLVQTIANLPGDWTPALLDGSPVRYFMSIPLNFIHQDANFQEIDFSGGIMHYNRY
jgi:hypothetical protein